MLIWILIRRKENPRNEGGFDRDPRDKGNPEDGDSSVRLPSGDEIPQN